MRRLLLQQYGSNGLRALLQQAILQDTVHVRPLLSHDDGADVLLRLQLPHEPLPAKRSDHAPHGGRPPPPSAPTSHRRPAAADAPAPATSPAGGNALAPLPRPLASPQPPQSPKPPQPPRPPPPSWTARYGPSQHGHEHGTGRHAEHDKQDYQKGEPAEPGELRKPGGLLAKRMKMDEGG